MKFLSVHSHVPSSNPQLWNLIKLSYILFHMKSMWTSYFVLTSEWLFEVSWSKTRTWSFWPEVRSHLLFPIPLLFLNYWMDSLIFYHTMLLCISYLVLSSNWLLGSWTLWDISILVYTSLIIWTGSFEVFVGPKTNLLVKCVHIFNPDHLPYLKNDIFTNLKNFTAVTTIEADDWLKKISVAYHDCYYEQ